MESGSNAYPNFKKITIEDKKVFDSFLHDYASYSDFNLLSLLSWNSGGHSAYSILNNNLVIKIKDYLGEGFVYSILGSDTIDMSLKTLLPGVYKLNFVPEIVVDHIVNRNDFIIEDDRDNYDYILPVDEISLLEGRKFKHLRDDVRSFEHTYKNYTVRTLDFNTEEIKEAVFTLTEKWCLSKGFSKEKLQEELEMLRSFVSYSDQYKCVFIGLFVGDTLVAFILNELLNDTEIMSHFGVSDREYKAGASMMEYVNAKYFAGLGYKLQNQQQDGGLSGLREAKMYYNPAYFLKKYIISDKAAI